MIDFVGDMYTPSLENRIMGYHGNHAFSHSQNKLRTKCFINWGSQ